MDASTDPPGVSDRLPLLDGMRGMAAVCVLGFHMQRAFHLNGPFASSYLFVDFFFLLSGFVLGLVAEPRMRQGMTWSTFMAARWRRLWPMIAVGAVLGAIRFSATSDAATTITLLVLALAMVPTRSSSLELFPLNGPQWSLLMELMANLAHVLVLAHLPLRRLVAVTVVFGALLMANILRAHVDPWMLAELRVGFSYSAGLVFARAYRQGAFVRLAGVDWKWPVALTAGAVLSLPYLPLPKNFGDVAIIFAIFPTAFVCAIGARLPAVLAPAMLWLGRLSYPLYAVHEPIIKMIASNPHTSTHPMLAALLAIGFAAALGWAFEPRRTTTKAPIALEVKAIA
jgi:peptidoglycan/LPS O-acetylase OafA/YrhL